MLTRPHVLAATAMLALAAGPAKAADLDHGFPPGSPYEDRRYSDIYRHPAPPTPAPRYAQPYYAPPPVYREEQRYAPPPPPAPYAEPRYRNDGRVAGDCLPRHVIRDRLESRGWHDFHDPQVAGNVAHIRARRGNGQVFDLTVDRCTGQVLGAEPFDNRSAQAPQPQPQWRYRDDRYRQY